MTTSATKPYNEWVREHARIIREFAQAQNKTLLDAFYFAQRFVIYEGWRQYPERPDPLFDVQIAIWGDPGEATTVTEHVAALKKLSELALAEAARVETAASTGRSTRPT